MKKKILVARTSWNASRVSNLSHFNAQKWKIPVASANGSSHPQERQTRTRPTAYSRFLPLFYLGSTASSASLNLVLILVCSRRPSYHPHVLLWFPSPDRVCSPNASFLTGACFGHESTSNALGSQVSRSSDLGRCGAVATVFCRKCS